MHPQIEVHVVTARPGGNQSRGRVGLQWLAATPTRHPVSGRRRASSFLHKDLPWEAREAARKETNCDAPAPGRQGVLRLLL